VKAHFICIMVIEFQSHSISTYILFRLRGYEPTIKHRGLHNALELSKILNNFLQKLTAAPSSFQQTDYPTPFSEQTPTVISLFAPG